MPLLPPFSETQLQAICDILGDTSDGLTGSEIGVLLASCGIEDSPATLIKRHRLFQALSQRQEQDQAANRVLAFIQSALDPARFAERKGQHKLLRDRLNEVLAFDGYQVGSDGRLGPAPKVRPSNEAEQRAVHLRSELYRRSVHPDVLRFCKAELVQESYYPVVRKTVQSVAEKVSEKCGLEGNGLELIDLALSLENGPKLAFNTLRMESERQEHLAFLALIEGLFLAFGLSVDAPNPVEWHISEQDALDLLSTVSLIHRRLDQCVSTGK